jgi:Protein of unknown function (DUF3306)
MSREQDKGFLSRWSSRKLAKETEESQDKSQPEEKAVEETAEQADDADKQHEDLPVWQREDVDSETKKAVLRTLFHKPEFHIRDGLNEYDDDFTQFSGLGDIVTHDMKRMLELAEEKSRPQSLTENESEPEDAEARREDDNNEDKDLA